MPWGMDAKPHSDPQSAPPRRLHPHRLPRGQPGWLPQGRRLGYSWIDPACGNPAGSYRLIDVLYIYIYMYGLTRSVRCVRCPAHHDIICITHVSRFPCLRLTGRALLCRGLREASQRGSVPERMACRNGNLQEGPDEDLARPLRGVPQPQVLYNPDIRFRKLCMCPVVVAPSHLRDLAS